MKNCFYLLILFVFTMVSCNNNKTEAVEENSTQEQQCSEQKNQVVDCIMSRRSIRAYKPEQIKDEELQTILECGINAPSARNSQPWEVRVIRDKDDPVRQLYLFPFDGPEAASYQACLYPDRQK